MILLTFAGGSVVVSALIVAEIVAVGVGTAACSAAGGVTIAAVTGASYVLVSSLMGV